MYSNTQKSNLFYQPQEKKRIKKVRQTAEVEDILNLLLRDTQKIPLKRITEKRLK